MADKFYITNLDWGDGSPKEFTNEPEPFYDGLDTFDHIYEKPGFYTIRGLVFEFDDQAEQVKTWERFESNMVINKSSVYDSPFFHDKDCAMIGGYNKESTYFKTLLLLSAYQLDGSKKFDIENLVDYNEYDKIHLIDTLLRFDIDLYDSYLDPYINPIFDSNGNLIHNNYSSKRYGDDFRNTNLNNVDVSSCKMYRGVRKMNKQLGFNGDESANPNNDSYWNNIIPKEWKWTDKTGIEYGVFREPMSGSKALVNEYKEYQIDDSAEQNWNNAYWPILPKLGRGGKFLNEVTSSYGIDEDEAPITNLNEKNRRLILDIDFNQDVVGDIIDKTSQFELVGTSDFTVGLDKSTRVEKIQSDNIELLEKKNSEQAF